MTIAALLGTTVELREPARSTHYVWPEWPELLLSAAITVLVVWLVIRLVRWRRRARPTDVTRHRRARLPTGR